MADGVPITAGSGTTIATDDAGAAGHVQVVKLALSADGSATAITADANGLEVQLGAALPAGTAEIGKVTHGMTGIGTGRTVVTTAGTRVVLASSTTARHVIITAETDNTGLIVVGGTAVVAALATRQGTPLNAGETVALDIDNLNDVNLDSTVSGDGVTYTYLT